MQAHAYICTESRDLCTKKLVCKDFKCLDQAQGCACAGPNKNWWPIAFKYSGDT